MPERIPDFLMCKAGVNTHRRTIPHRGGSPNKPPLALADFAADFLPQLSTARTRAFFVSEFVYDFFTRKMIRQRATTVTLLTRFPLRINRFAAIVVRTDISVGAIVR